METNKKTLHRREVLYLGLTTFFSVVLILSNLISVKLIQMPFVPHIAVPCGLLIFPLTFFVSDVITEIYGASRARFAIYLGFVMALISHGVIQSSISLPVHPNWALGFNPFGYTDSGAFQKAYYSVFGLNGIAILSSITAYAVAQVLDIRLFVFLKEITHGQHLWIRNLGSTLTSQLVDTFIICTLVFFCGMKMELTAVMDIALVSYAYKTLISVSFTPLFYLSINLSKRYLQEPTEKTSKLLEKYG